MESVPAGGHLRSLMALTQNQPRFQPAFPGTDTSVRGAVPFYSVYDFTNASDLRDRAGLQTFLERTVMKKPMNKMTLHEYKDASPLFHIHEAAPPFMIVHGDKDTLVPVEEARMFATRLSGVSDNPVVHAEISSGQHAFDMFPSIRSEHVKHGVERYLAYLFSRYLRHMEPAMDK